MNWVEDLRLHVDALLAAMETDKKFFAPVMHYVKELRRILSLSSPEVSKSSFVTPARKIKEFWDSYKSDDSTPGLVYFPPEQTSNTENTVDEIYSIITKLTAMPDAQFAACFPPSALRIHSDGSVTRRKSRGSAPHVIFIGHGRSKLWARVKIHIENELNLNTLEFESESRVGQSVVPILEGMLDKSSFAILILTAEDETKDGARRARQNVIHEAGLFQGRLGFEKVVLLKQDGVEDLSNLAGLQYIAFSGESVEQTFYELGRVLKREGVLV
jgi:predicted nucleotide-binding protein